MLHDYRAITPDDVRTVTDAALSDADRLVDEAAAGVTDPSFAAVMQPLDAAWALVADGYGRTAFLGQAHPDPAVRDVAQEAEERINKWRVGLPFREDLYRAVAASAETPEARQLEGERRRLLDMWLRDFRRAGQELDPERRGELERLRSRLVELEVAFQRNINEYTDAIEVTREELDGLPEDFVARLAPGATPQTFRVSLDYPELYPFLEQAHDRGRREELFRKHWSRCVAANRPLLEEALRLRQRIAQLLGHPSWAHFALELRMASDPARVASFYADLVPPIEAATARELEEMRRLTADRSPSGDATVAAWDWRYLDERQRRDRYGLDANVVAEYLPLGAVVDGMFALTGEVLGLTYRRVAEPHAWHPAVELYEVRDRTSGRLLAHFYADWFPRDGKFGHAAAFPLVLGRRLADGSYQSPVNAILANFTPPSGDRPALLKHDELGTLFHEFGHILHMSLTTAEFARFSGAETETDFIEAPSQIMEHWTWDPAVLAGFARHYRTGEPIPRSLVEQLVAARNLNVGLKSAVQIFYGSLDLGVHDGVGADQLDAVLRRSYAVTGLPYPEGTFLPSGFGHLMGGYDAGYYGYLWAEVIGDDMFGRFLTEGITSPDVGSAYRREILEPNGARPAEEMVRAFLGREPSNAAWLELRGMRAEDRP